VILIIIGVVGLLLAAVLAFVGIEQLGKLQAFEETKTYTARALRDLHDKAGNTFVLPCEVFGEVECDEPLVAPLSQQPCVIYLHTIIREREEEHVVQRQGGMYGSSTGVSPGVEKEIREVRERMPDERQHTPFWVRDSTGRTLVLPEGAELDLEKTTEQFEESEGWMYSGSRNRTRGYLRTEYVLSSGSQCYVLGCAVDRNERPVVTRHPHDNRKKFLISYRSEDQLTQRTSMLALASLIAAVVLGLGGVVLIVLGLR
jgi:hypothetical protein